MSASVSPLRMTPKKLRSYNSSIKNSINRSVKKRVLEKSSLSRFTPVAKDLRLNKSNKRMTFKGEKFTNSRHNFVNSELAVYKPKNMRMKKGSF